MVDILPERRIYIKPEDVSKYKSKGLTVYKGPKGGYYIDSQEAHQEQVDIEKEQVNVSKSFEKSVSDFDNITTVVDDYDIKILEFGFEKLAKRFARGMTKYPKHVLYNALLEGDFWKKYSGLTDAQSRKINEILVNAVLEGKYTKPELVAKIIAKEVGIPERRAFLIARTELAYIANKAREIAYKNLTNVQKFVWITERDSKVCDKCKKMAELTQNGVTLDEIKKLLKQVAPETSRELLVHPGCRCSIYRYYDDKRYVRWWEKADIPPERRVYIKPQDALKFQQAGITVYRGKRGGMYVDREEVRQKGFGIEKLEQRRKRYYSKYFNKLVEGLKQSGLEEQSIDAIQKLLSGDDEKAIEGYYELRGLIRKVSKEIGMSSDVRLKLYWFMRKFMENRYGFDPAKRRLKEEMSKIVDISKVLKEKMLEYDKTQFFDIKREAFNVLDEIYKGADKKDLMLANVINALAFMIGDFAYLSSVEKEREISVLEKQLGLLAYFSEKISSNKRELLDKFVKKNFGVSLNDIRSSVKLPYIKVKNFDKFILILQKMIDYDYSMVDNAVFSKTSLPVMRELKKYANKVFSKLKEYSIYSDGKLYYVPEKKDVRKDLYDFPNSLISVLAFAKYYGEDDVVKSVYRVLGQIGDIIDDDKYIEKLERRVHKKYRVIRKERKAFDKYFEDTGLTLKDAQNIKLTFRQYEDIRKYCSYMSYSGDCLMSFQEIAVAKYNNGKQPRNAKEYVFLMYKFFKDLGYDDRTSVALAKGWEVMRAWTLNKFKMYTGHIEEMVHKIRGNHRPKRTKHDISSSDLYEIFKNTRPEEVYAYKKFTEQFVSLKYGDNVPVYRGVSEWEILQILASVFQNPDSFKTLRLRATLVSTSLNYEVANTFAYSGFVIEMRVPPKYVWGGWWNASPSFLQEEEIIVEIPDDGSVTASLELDNLSMKVRPFIEFVAKNKSTRVSEAEYEELVSSAFSTLDMILEIYDKSIEMIPDRDIVDKQFIETIKGFSKAFDRLVLDDKFKRVVKRAYYGPEFVFTMLENFEKRGLLKYDEVKQFIDKLKKYIDEKT